MLSELKIFKDMFTMFISSGLLVLVVVYSGEEQITHRKLMLMFLGSMVAGYIALGPIEYFFPESYNSPQLHDFMVAISTLTSFQLLVIGHKRKLLLKFYKNKMKDND